MKKKRTILEYKHCSNDLGTKTYPYSTSVKIITNFQNELNELMQISIIYSNQ